jgi:hypothetical protein
LVNYAGGANEWFTRWTWYAGHSNFGESQIFQDSKCWMLTSST